MDRIKLIWDFRGPQAEGTAEHHAIHLGQFAKKETIPEYGYGHEVEAENHAIAFLVVDRENMIAVRDALRPTVLYLQIRMNKLALITGATAGFGKATAELLASENHDLIITGRRQERLSSLKEVLEEKHGVKVIPLCFDVRDRDATETALNELPEELRQIDILVNNAGLAAGKGPIQDGDIDDWERMIDTNVKGLLYVSRTVTPWMIERGKGHVINIGSTAGKEVYANGNVYCASKHAVDALSKGMRIDLLGKGIKVTQIAPGAAETEFSLVRYHGDETQAKKVYEGYKPMSAEDIAGLVLMVTSLPPHLCINDLVVTSLAQANSFYIDRN